MARKHSDSIAWLNDEYRRRKSSNPRYSLRAFAKSLAIASGPLSEIMAQKRALSPKLAARIAERLRYSDETRDRFLSSVDDERTSRRFLRQLGGERAFRELAEDRFSLIKEWHHFAILAALDCGLGPRAIAKRLGLTLRATREALARLARLGLVDHELKPTGSLTTTQDVPSEAIRAFHRENLARATRALELPVDERDVTSITFAIDPKQLPLAKEAIKRFRREMASLLQRGTLSDVYNLTVMLFPGRVP